MKSKTTIHTVAGCIYEVWSDYIARATFAQDQDGIIKRISSSGYIRNDLTVRKAIANAFNVPTFRK